MQTKSIKNSNEANAVNNAPKQAAAPAPKKGRKAAGTRNAFANQAGNSSRTRRTYAAGVATDAAKTQRLARTQQKANKVY